MQKQHPLMKRPNVLSYSRLTTYWSEILTSLYATYTNSRSISLSLSSL